VLHTRGGALLCRVTALMNDQASGANRLTASDALSGVIVI
jgi:hypothetical protein